MYEDSNTHYRDENGNPQPLPAGYKVHPAFQKMKEATATESGDAELGNPLGKWSEELEGIWGAKYEASQETYTNGSWQASGTISNYGGGNNLTNSTRRMVSKPTRLNWRHIAQSYIYTNSLNMHSALNSHEMKNSEWGAVAYLTQRAYGRNGNEIGVNENYVSDYGSYTGGGP